MRRKNVAVSAIIWVAAGFMLFTGCNRERSAFILVAFDTELSSVNSDGGMQRIPVNPAFMATFNYDVDVTAAIAENITMIRDFDQVPVGIKVIAIRNTITISPEETLYAGAVYHLSITERILSVGGQSLENYTFTFTTNGIFSPSGEVAYWNFEETVNDQVGTFNPCVDGIVDIRFDESHNSASGTAAVFDGDQSIIEIPNGDELMNTCNFTLSFWVKTNSTGHVDEEGKCAGYFVLGMAAFYGFHFEIAPDFSWCNFVARYDVKGGIPICEDLLFLGDGKTMETGGSPGTEYCKNLCKTGGVASLLKDKWAHIVCMFDSPAKSGSLFINGEKMKVVNFNLWPFRDVRRNISGLKFDGRLPETSNELAFGFLRSRAGSLLETNPRYGYAYPTANHFKGQLDDVRIFHKVLPEAEIRLMYEAGK
jgi:hypothetical protein